MRDRYLLPALALAASCASPGAPATPRPVVSPAPPSTSATSTSWTSLRAAARDALRTHDVATYRARLLDLYALSGSAQIVYELAGAELALGNREATHRYLTLYASMGLIPDPADPDLAKALGTEEFVEVAGRLATNRTPVSHATAGFSLPHDDLIAEGIAWDAPSRTYFVSSVRKRTILAFDGTNRSGASRNFLPHPGPDIGALCGMVASGGRLWATMATLPQMLGFDQGAPAPTALLAFDLGTAALVERFDLPASPGQHALTDLAPAAQGDSVFVSDALGGMVYVARRGSGKLAPLVAPGALVYPQTPAPTPDGRRLFVPDYVRGIASVDIARGETVWLAHPPEIALNGIDDLHLVGQSLLAIQNGTNPPRIMRFWLDVNLSRIERAEILEQLTPGLGEPTHGVVVDKTFWFIADGGWGRFDASGAPEPSAPPEGAAVMKLAL